VRLFLLLLTAVMKADAGRNGGKIVLNVGLAEVNLARVAPLFPHASVDLDAYERGHRAPVLALLFQLPA
jgi:hypothetical protein